MPLEKLSPPLIFLLTFVILVTALKRRNKEAQDWSSHSKEEPLRGLAKDVLEGMGYCVMLAKNGEEAVETFKSKQEQIDLVLLDVVMPRMGGHEAHERMRELNKDVPIIFMTGYSAETVQSKFVRQNKFMEGLGAALIQKPYNVEVLGRKVREVLDARRRR